DAFPDAQRRDDVLGARPACLTADVQLQQPDRQRVSRRARRRLVSVRFVDHGTHAAGRHGRRRLALRRPDDARCAGGGEEAGHLHARDGARARAGPLALQDRRGESEDGEERRGDGHRHDPVHGEEQRAGHDRGRREPHGLRCEARGRRARRDRQRPRCCGQSERREWRRIRSAHTAELLALSVSRGSRRCDQYPRPQSREARLRFDGRAHATRLQRRGHRRDPRRQRASRVRHHLAGMIAAILAVALVTISTRQDIFESRYEKLSGTVRVGDVTSSLYVLQPRFAGESNGAALIEVADEAHRTLLRRFNRGGPNPDPETSADLGDGFLMKFGFTLVWVDQPAVVADLAASMRAPDAVVAAKHVYEWTMTPRVVRDFGSGKVFYIRTADDPATRAAGDTSRAYHFVGASADPGRLPPDNTVDYWW